LLRNARLLTTNGTLDNSTYLIRWILNNFKISFSTLGTTCFLEQKKNWFFLRKTKLTENSRMALLSIMIQLLMEPKFLHLQVNLKVAFGVIFLITYKICCNNMQLLLTSVKQDVKLWWMDPNQWKTKASNQHGLTWTWNKDN